MGFMQFIMNEGVKLKLTVDTRVNSTAKTL